MNFDPVARWYRWLEGLAFGDALQRCRVALIEHTRNAANVLILGEGDGRFLEAFLRSNPTADVTVVDSSREMVRLAKARIGRSDRVTFLCGDVRHIDLGEQEFDLIVTHFFLDCFDEENVRRVVGDLRQRLSDAGRWLWSDFAIPAGGWVAMLAKGVVWGLYRFFRLTTRIEATRLVNVEMIFNESGMEMRSERSFINGLIHSELWEAQSR